ncbi:hypothetical protein Hanom_Chr05g00432181 [Helianthus anomalus]
MRLANLLDRLVLGDYYFHIYWATNNYILLELHIFENKVFTIKMISTWTTIFD